jgi:uncharacterized protein (DUF488 family)
MFSLPLGARNSTAVRGMHLYTLGYEGLDVETFVASLLEVGVRSVVDVRELPLSRKRGFSKRALAGHLKTAGIAYFHAPTLGCPKQIRDRYRKDGDWKAYTRDFLAHLRCQQATVDELARIALANTACLVCFEANHETCHRSYVARAATAAGAPAVYHLKAAGTTRPGLKRAA